MGWAQGDARHGERAELVASAAALHSGMLCRGIDNYSRTTGINSIVVVNSLVQPERGVLAAIVSLPALMVYAIDSSGHALVRNAPADARPRPVSLLDPSVRSHQPRS
jgi:hypothetical protein